VSSRLPIRRQSLLILGLFAILIVAVLLFGRTGSVGRAYDLDSRQPDGLLLLRRWLQAMDYEVTATGRTSFAVPADADLFVIYPGLATYTESEAAALVRWVEEGGTLAIIGTGNPALADALDFEFTSPDFASMARSAQQAQPVLPAAPALWTGPGPVSLPQAAAGAVPVLTISQGDPAVWVQARGEGLLWLLAQRYAFVNADLMEDEQPYLWLALLRSVPASGKIVFDTYHLFGPDPLASGRIGSIQDWLYGTPTGWATLFLLLLGLLYLFLSGRRLGPPLTIPTQGRRREAAEFVVAMAGLQRRARVSDSIARHHRRRLLLALGRSYGIPADLDDQRFLSQLRVVDPMLSDERAARIERVLAGLSALPDEETLVGLVAEVDQILNRSEKDAIIRLPINSLKDAYVPIQPLHPDQK
jgi:hypothetical protein